MKGSKAAIAVGRIVSLVQIGIGAFVLFMFGICTISYLVDPAYREGTDASFLPILLILDAIGILCIVMARRRMKLIKLFKKYVTVLSSESTGSIAKIAGALGKPEDVVKGNLELMIKKKYFSNAYINQETGCIIIGNANKNIQNQATPEQNVQQNKDVTAPKVELVSVACPCCGGMNSIAKGSVSECDYCGSPIQG